MKNIIFRLVPKMSIKKLSGFCFAAVTAVASCLQAQAQTQVSIPKRIIQRPADSTTPGGVAVVAMPQNICTASNNNCFNTTFPQAPGGGVATIRPWTSYFLGQTKTQPGAFWYNKAVTVFCDEGPCTVIQPQYHASTIVNIDLNGFVTARQPSSRYPINLGQPTANETLEWRPGYSVYCIAYPTWSNNSNKLAGLAPDGWASEGGDPQRGVGVGCGPYADPGYDPLFAPD